MNHEKLKKTQETYYKFEMFNFGTSQKYQKKNNIKLILGLN